MSMYAVVDPATGETLKEYPTITDDELRDAIARADRAHREWSKASTVADRASLVRRVGELHTERRKELAEIIAAEMGKPIGQARGEIAFCASIYGFYADNAEALMADEPIELLDGEGSAVVRRSSLGALLGIMPWRSEEHTSELQSPVHLVCRLLLEKKKKKKCEPTVCQELTLPHHSSQPPSSSSGNPFSPLLPTKRSREVNLAKRTQRSDHNHLEL